MTPFDQMESYRRSIEKICDEALKKHQKLVEQLNEKKNKILESSTKLSEEEIKEGNDQLAVIVEKITENLRAPAMFYDFADFCVKEKKALQMMNQVYKDIYNQFKKMGMLDE
jgi:hypothetical protein